MAGFENYEQRIGTVGRFLNRYGISDLEEAKKICEDAGIDGFGIVKEVQPISFEDAGWAYTAGAAAATGAGAAAATGAAAGAGAIASYSSMSIASPCSTSTS